MDISHPALSALDVNLHIGQNHDGTGAANPKAKYGQALYLPAYSAKINCIVALQSFKPVIWHHFAVFKVVIAACPIESI